MLVEFDAVVEMTLVNVFKKADFDKKGLNRKNYFAQSFKVYK